MVIEVHMKMLGGVLTEPSPHTCRMQKPCQGQVGWRMIGRRLYVMKHKLQVNKRLKKSKINQDIFGSF